VVIPVGILNNLETIIGGITFSLDYYVIDPATPSSYLVLLGRPWLYTAKVHVSWNEKKISFGRPRVHLSWAIIKHEGETDSIDEGYTSDQPSNQEENVLDVNFLLLSCQCGDNEIEGLGQRESCSTYTENPFISVFYFQK
jgi:hypothetical protein